MDPLWANLTTKDLCKYSLDISFQLPGLVSFPLIAELPKIGTVPAFTSSSQMKSTLSPFLHLPRGCEVHFHTFHVIPWDSQRFVFAFIPILLVMKTLMIPMWFYLSLLLWICLMILTLRFFYQRPVGRVDLKSCIRILRIRAKAARQCSSVS